MESKIVITIDQFFSLTKVIRMLYGVKPAGIFFEKNCEVFTGFTPEQINSLPKENGNAIVDTPRD